MNKGMTRTVTQAGMTMIETMVAMTISAVLVLGSITVYDNARKNYRTAENIARLQENLRFATDTLDRDVRLAGYWGRTNEDALIVRNAGVQVTCAGNDVTAWALPQPAVIGVDASDDTYDPAWGCPGVNARADSDALIVRHASTNQAIVPVADRVQLFATSGDGQIFSNGVAPAPVVPNENQIYDVVVNVYYVSNQSKYSNTMPSLRRRSLVGMTMEDQEVIAGVENLQVQFGIDRNADGQADGYVDEDHPAMAAAGTDIVSVRLWLLVRGDEDEIGQGYEDDHAYRTPDADGLVIVPDGGTEYPQSYRRYAFTKTIMLKN
jgi:type IV pilus assembly protein PilW